MIGELLQGQLELIGLSFPLEGKGMFPWQVLLWSDGDGISFDGYLEALDRAILGKRSLEAL